MENAEKKHEEIFNEFINRNGGEIFFTGKIIGSGSFSQIREVKMKNKILAAKIIHINKKESNDDSSLDQEVELSLDLRSPNIIKINKIYEEVYNNETYDLVLMEKAILRDLGKLNDFYHRHNLLKLKFSPFFVDVSENLTRFYVRQIILSLEVLDRNDCIHFDIKPENILITYNLTVKLSDFSLLRDLKKTKTNKIKIPGGTSGYLTPEYYYKDSINAKYAKTQDYFALGSTIYYLKFGSRMLKYNKYDEKDQCCDRIIDLLQRKIAFIKSNILIDVNFRNFLCSLIQYRPEDRPNFEEVYRNKWVNENKELLDKILYLFENDEEKLIMELQKSDFLLQKERELKTNEQNCLKKFKLKKINRKHLLKC